VLPPARAETTHRSVSVALQHLCSRRACAAALRQIIANEQGNRTTPSYVAFTDTDRCVPIAKERFSRKHQRTRS
jgi:molecular chaperone DnaK (HSP70)